MTKAASSSPGLARVRAPGVALTCPRARCGQCGGRGLAALGLWRMRSERIEEAAGDEVQPSAAPPSQH